jgi:hypothetical protein
MNRAPFTLRGWWIAAFLAVLFGALASHSLTKDDRAWALIFGVLCLWSIRETRRCHALVAEDRGDAGA